MAGHLSRGAFFTDIHFGKKNNSDQHNMDCIRFIEWFCDKVKSDGGIDYIGFLGDWNENRSAINISTLNYSYIGAKKINDLGLPVYFIIGNHDLYHRHTREVHSILPFSEFSNFKIINTPTVVSDIYSDALFSPYVFEHEYDILKKYNSIPFWGGHFEFKGFKLTGYGNIMQSGKDPSSFIGPQCIASGHFHTRQISRNITYIGNTFPMDFGDSGDNHRGMMVYDHINQKKTFIDWDACPKYTKILLSDIVSGNFSIPVESRVKCVVDVTIDYNKMMDIKEAIQNELNLRELSLDDGRADTINSKIEDQVNDISGGSYNIDDVIIELLNSINNDKLSNKKLVDLYLTPPQL